MCDRSPLDVRNTTAQRPCFLLLKKKNTQVCQSDTPDETYMHIILRSHSAAYSVPCQHQSALSSCTHRRIDLLGATDSKFGPLKKSGTLLHIDTQ